MKRLRAARRVPYDYCSMRCGAALSRKGIRRSGDSIPAEGFEAPAVRVNEEPPEDTGEASMPVLDLVIASNLEDVTAKTGYSVALS